MSKFLLIDRDTPLPLPSVQELLPKGHLARYIVEVVEGLDLRGYRHNQRLRNRNKLIILKYLHRKRCSDGFENRFFSTEANSA
jgi:hypothetical protein